MKFTSRQKEIYDLILAGDSDDDIITKLNITKSTLKFHITNILRITGHPHRLLLYKEHADKLRAELREKERVKELENEIVRRKFSEEKELDFLARHQEFTQYKEFYVNKFNLEVEKIMRTHKSKEDIAKAWDKVMQRMHILPESAVSNRMISYLFEELNV